VKRIGAVLAAVGLVVLAVGASALAAPSAHVDEHALQADASPLSGQPVETESEAPEPDEPDEVDSRADSADASGAPSPQLLDRLVGRLTDAGIDADADTISGLAARYGVGGAVRLIAWADASGHTTDEIAAMFDDGMGWGQIAHQLNASDDTLHLSPGIGWLMGKGHQHDGGPGNGVGKALGKASAPGQQNK
jgi:hypothetical protein